MRIQFVQHDSFGDPGAILHWAEWRGHEYDVTRIYAGEELPSLESWDWLVIMGGPMSIHDENEHSWLKREKEIIRKAISNDKIVMGICLGSQLIAEALGANVYNNDQKEIGWFPVQWTMEGPSALHLQSLPSELPVFHSHVETFDLPEGAVLIASSKACKNQAFAFGSKVFGFQFHFEMLARNVMEMLDNFEDEQQASPNIQSRTEMLTDLHFHVDQATKVLYAFLNQLENQRP